MPDEPDTFERDRLAADARYNDALTAFDRAVAASRGREMSAEDFERFSHTLIIFLQQITALVDTKDRAVTSELRERIDEMARIRADMDELRTRFNVLQRGISHQSAAGRQPSVVGQQSAGSSQQWAESAIQLPAASAQSPAADQSSVEDVVYLAFEDAFRGTDEAVAAKLSGYVPIFAGASDVVDLGCGRGEFLDALRSAGGRARGVDTNAEMVKAARERGLDVRLGDALEFVRQCDDASLGGAIATQVIEHLQPAYLVALLRVLSRKLRPGAPIVLETINPACWLAFFSSYIRDLTHAQPLHPETLQYMLRASGFQRVEIRYRSLLPDSAKLGIAHIPADVRASTDPIAVALTRSVEIFDWNVDRLNELMFGPMDYAVVGYKSPNDRDAS
jgi:SAM-dependent methyltransferase